MSVNNPKHEHPGGDKPHRHTETDELATHATGEERTYSGEERAARGETDRERVQVREERVELEKKPVVTEEIELGKRRVQDTQQVSGTVRREEARIEGEGDVDVERRA